MLPYLTSSTAAYYLHAVFLLNHFFFKVLINTRDLNMLIATPMFVSVYNQVYETDDRLLWDPSKLSDAIGKYSLRPGDAAAFVIIVVFHLFLMPFVSSKTSHYMGQW
jgi:hypothetical protein